jgi:biopolymer transport protein ExbB/TolQ
MKPQLPGSTLRPGRIRPWRAAPDVNLDDMRPIVSLASGVAGVLICIFWYYVLPDGAAKILIDRNGLLYPFSVQNGMWVVFCIAVGELLIRMSVTRAEFAQLRMRYLPEDPRTVLQAHDLKDIYRRIRERGDAASRRFLPQLISRCILQFQASTSIGQSASLLNTSVELFAHEIDLRYSMLRYITWLIPSLGFVGTVIGIGHALSYAGEPGRFQQPTLLTEVTARLAVSFDGTLVALLMAAVLLFFQHYAQSREERALNLAGQYCLDNLINRLYVPKEG